jgi:hypothetical protein
LNVAGLEAFDLVLWMHERLRSSACDQKRQEIDFVCFEVKLSGLFNQSSIVVAVSMLAEDVKCVGLITKLSWKTEEQQRKL